MSMSRECVGDGTHGLSESVFAENFDDHQTDGPSQVGRIVCTLTFLNSDF